MPLARGIPYLGSSAVDHHVGDAVDVGIAARRVAIDHARLGQGAEAPGEGEMLIVVEHLVSEQQQTALGQETCQRLYRGFSDGIRPSKIEPTNFGACAP